MAANCARFEKNVDSTVLFKGITLKLKKNKNSWKLAIALGLSLFVLITHINYHFNTITSIHFGYLKNTSALYIIVDLTYKRKQNILEVVAKWCHPTNTWMQIHNIAGHNSPWGGWFP